MVSVLVLSIVSRRAPPETIDFSVIDAPMQAPSPLRAITPARVQPKPKAPPRAVFGAAKNSVLSQEAQDLTTKLGNTVAKEQDDKQLKADDPDSIPIPVEDYLVSSMPVLVSSFRLPYPPEASKRGIQGAVVFDLIIDDQGFVREAVLIEGPGAGLNEAAAAGIKKFRFKPATVENKTVAVKIRYAYRFILEK